MKTLSLELLRSFEENIPDDLGEVIKRFQKFSKSLASEMVGSSSQRITFTPGSCEKAQLRPVISKEGNFPGISRRLCDSKTGSGTRVTLDRQFVFILCDLVFGGDASEPSIQEGRPLSGIERDIASSYINSMARHLMEGLLFPSETDLKIERVGEKMELGEMPIFKPAIKMNLTASVGSLKGELTFEFSSSFVSHINESAREVGSVGVETPSNWSGQILASLELAEVELIATLVELPLKLDAISRLRVGQTISLGVDIQTAVAVHAGETKLYGTHLGQSDGSYCLIVDQVETNL